MALLSLKETFLLNRISNSLLNVNSTKEQKYFEETVHRGGWLLGVKDVFHCEGSQTRIGTQNEVLGEEGTLIKRFKKVGGIPIKTSLTPLIFMDPCDGCIHPSRPSKSAGGSSTGSCVAVSTGQVRFSLGTQCSGSIIRPAAYHGIIGFKPSKGTVPTDGVECFSHSIDQIGYFANTISDVRWMHSVAIGSSDTPPPVVDNSTESLTPLSEFSFGVPQQEYLSKSELDVFDLIKNKITLTKHITIPDLDKVYKSQKELAIFEAREQWYDFWKDNCNRSVAPKINEMMTSTTTLSKSEVESHQSFMMSVRSQIESQMDDKNISILVTPSTVECSHSDLSERSTGDPSMNIPWNFVGVPVINIPVPSNSNISSLQLIARHGDDELLLRAGEALQHQLCSV